MHSHILPGIDDGSPNVDVSLILIEAMQRWGIENIIATPHVTEETFENTPKTIAASHRLLCESMQKAGITIPVSYSAEYRIDSKFKEIMKNGSLIKMPNNYILIENSFVQPSLDLKSIIFELQLKELKPILAHPERYNYYQRKRQSYTELFEAGCEFQINLLSLCGYYGEIEKEIAMWLIKKEYISFIGTDLHHFGHIEAINNYLTTKEYTNIAAQLEPTLKNGLLI
ncbi:MAG: CpsB/CapC family capsule biosynthesis tyrosine phosphatase [Bacteroidales bacterium]